jgi:hypothetical protein
MPLVYLVRKILSLAEESRKGTLMIIASNP